MPGYPDEPVSRQRDPRRERRPPPRDYDDYNDDAYRRPAAKSRDPSYEPRTSARHARRETYDASDEDEYVPRRRHRDGRSSPKEKPQIDSDIPPPPIGDDRKEYTSSARRHRGEERPPPGAIPVPGTEAADPYNDHSDDRRRQRRSGRGAYDEPEDPATDRSGDRKHHRKPPRSPPSGAEDDVRGKVPDRKHANSTRDPYGDSAARDADPPTANERRQRKSGRSPYDADPEPAPVARKPSRRHREEYDDVEPPRRSKPRDAYDDEPPRRRDPYAEPPRRRDHRTARPAPEDSDEYDPPPRRREDRDRHRYNDGYGTDRPRRAARDDPYERGYRTDGRDARRSDRDRDHRRADPRRDDRRRPDDRYADDYDTARRGSKPKNGKHGAFDVDNIMHNGKKNWEKVAPVAKPLLAQLANTYLNNGGKGGGVPH